MATWVFNIDFQNGDGWENIASNVILSTLKKTERKYTDDYRPYIDTCSFQMTANETIYNKILTSTKDILISITKDSAAYFTGFVRKNNFSFKIDRRTRSAQIECVNRLWLFKKKIKTTQQMANFKISNPSNKAASIIHVLGVQAGFTTATISCDLIDTTIDYLVTIENEQSYDTVLADILYQHGYVYDTDNAGNLVVYSYIADDTTTTASIDVESNAVGEIVPGLKDKNFDGVHVIWYEHKTIIGATVFNDTTNGTAAYSCVIPVAAGGYWPAESGVRSVYADYRLDDYSIICVLNATESVTKDSQIVLQEFTNYYKRAKIRYYNEGGTTGNITKYQISGDAVVKGNINSTIREEVEGSEKIQKIEAAYIGSAAAAERLANGLAQLYKYGNIEFAASSYDYFEAGTFLDLVDGLNLGFDTRCSVQEVIHNDYTGIYNYRLRPIEPYQASTVLTSAVYVQPKPVSGGQIPGYVDKASYTDIIDGFDAGGGTTTPTTVILSATGIYKGVKLRWDRQANLTNLAGYEVMKSTDVSTYTNALGVGVLCQGEFYVDAPIAFGGTEENPTAVTVYYKVRRVTKEPLYGVYSSVQSATTSLIDTGDYAAQSVTINKAEAGFIQAGFLLAGKVIVGYYGSGSPSSPAEGDRQTYIEDDELRQEEYTGGGWSTVNGIKIGGALAGLFMSLIACRGMYHPEAPPSTVEFFPNNNYRVYNFENNYQNQYGVDDWGTKTNQATSTAQKKFGSYSFFATSGNISTLEMATGGAAGSDQSYAGWFYHSNMTLPVPAYCIYLQSTDTKDSIILFFSGNDLVVYVKKNNVLKLEETVKEDTAYSAWVYLAMSYKASTDTLSVVYNNQITEFASIGGTWGTQNMKMYISAYNNYAISGPGSEITMYADEVCIAPDQYIAPEIWAQHYNHNLAWSTSFSAADLVFRCHTGGRIRFDTRQAEESCGTLHIISAVNRPAYWILAGGTSSTYADVDFSAYTPYGVKALLLGCVLIFTGNATADDVAANFRKNGDTTDDDEKNFHTVNGETNWFNNGVHIITRELTVDCDANGIIEYKVTTNGSVYLNIMGYWI